MAHRELLSKDQLCILGNNVNGNVVGIAPSQAGSLRQGRAKNLSSRKDYQFIPPDTKHQLQVKPIEALRQMTQSFDGLSSFSGIDKISESQQ